MPQLQLALFAEGITAITAEIGFACKDGQVTYFYGHLPLFHHPADDTISFRIVTSQMILSGAVRERDILRAFPVPRITVRRSVAKLRDEGIASFFQDRRRGYATVLKAEVRQRAQQLLDEGKKMPEIGRECGSSSGASPDSLPDSARSGQRQE